jgi:hypothetical protein
MVDPYAFIKGEPNFLLEMLPTEHKVKVNPFIDALFYKSSSISVLGRID